VFTARYGHTHTHTHTLSLSLSLYIYIYIQPAKTQWSLSIPSGLTFNNFTFCPHRLYLCFVWISEQTAIISLYSVNWLVFITETECVYYAVRTWVFKYNWRLYWQHHLSGGYRVSVSAGTRIWSQAIPCETRGGQSGSGTDFSLRASLFPYQCHSTSGPCSCLLSCCSYHVKHLKPGSLPLKECSFGSRAALDRKNAFCLFSLRTVKTKSIEVVANAVRTLTFWHRSFTFKF
jgi:hypothetical protein